MAMQPEPGADIGDLQAFAGERLFAAGAAFGRRDGRGRLR